MQYIQCKKIDFEQNFILAKLTSLLDFKVNQNKKNLMNQEIQSQKVIITNQQIGSQQKQLKAQFTTRIIQHNSKFQLNQQITNTYASNHSLIVKLTLKACQSTQKYPNIVIMNTIHKIPLQLQQQRQQRHNKLLNMINSYELTREQKTKLQKIKSHTMMEINLRYLRSEINRNYNFPKFNKSKDNSNSSSQKSYQMMENDQEEDKILKEQLEETYDSKGKRKKKPSEYFTYNLRSQNQNKKQTSLKEPQLKTYSTKVLSLEQSRRVHSLGNDKSLQKQREDFITKRHNPIRNSSERFTKSPQGIGQSKSSKSLKTLKPISLTRRSSKQNLVLESSVEKFTPLGINSKKILVQSRKLKLPQINPASSSQAKSMRKLIPIHEKLKTEKYYEEEDIQYAIGKKLVTQTTVTGKRTVKGVEKYLRQLQTQKKQFNLNNQPGKIMKKDKDQQKKGTYFQVFNSAKQSLKRQIQ